MSQNNTHKKDTRLLQNDLYCGTAAVPELPFNPNEGKCNVGSKLNQHIMYCLLKKKESASKESTAIQPFFLIAVYLQIASIVEISSHLAAA